MKTKAAVIRVIGQDWEITELGYWPGTGSQLVKRRGYAD
jgi:hypothetical protein